MTLRLSCISSAFLIGTSVLFGSLASATVVQFQTSMGNFEVNLFDRTTPRNVENFLAYISAYSSSVVHRSEPGFVIQGGGYNYSGALPLTPLAARPSVVNEPIYSNLRGTIAMAKLPSNPNSATSEWFINLGNNSQNLDLQNGGFTVFGQVTGNGMAVVDAIAAVSRFNLGGAFTSIPLRNYTDANLIANVPVTGENFVLVQSVVVVDPNLDSAVNLTPVRNTLLTASPATPATPNTSGDGGGGGNLGIVSLLALAFLAWMRFKALPLPTRPKHAQVRRL